MKRIALLLFLSVALLGCPSATSPTPPLAPGFSSQADQTMNQILVGARAFYNTIQCETQAKNWAAATNQCVSDPNITTPMVLSATEKTAINDFGVSLNAANAVYKAYHAGTATQDQAQVAVNTVQAKQAALPALAVTK